MAFWSNKLFCGNRYLWIKGNHKILKSFCKLFTGHYLNKQAALMKITFLTEEWTQSTKGSCSTFMRQMAIELSRLENVEIGILIPSASQEDKEDAQKYNIKVFEPEEYAGFKPVDCLQFPPQALTLSLVMALSLDAMDRSLRITLAVGGCMWS